MVDDAQNKDSMKEAIDTLNQIVSSNSTPKTIKKAITDLITNLSSQEFSLCLIHCTRIYSLMLSNFETACHN